MSSDSDNEMENGMEDDMDSEVDDIEVGDQTESILSCTRK
jgi:hypothetical protein